MSLSPTPLPRPRPRYMRIAGTAHSLRGEYLTVMEEKESNDNLPMVFVFWEAKVGFELKWLLLS